MRGQIFVFLQSQYLRHIQHFDKNNLKKVVYKFSVLLIISLFLQHHSFKHIQTMQTLNLQADISAQDKTTQINKFRLANKNKWFQVNAHTNDGRIVKMKIYNTWAQLCYVYNSNLKLLYNRPNTMDMPVKEFKSYLLELLK